MQGDPALARWLPVGTNSRSLLLLVAILPALTFLGHWPALVFPVPGVEAVIAVPFFGHDGNSFAADSHANEQEHEQHCHANASSCSDVPFTGASAFALMNTAVASLGRNAHSVQMFATSLNVPTENTLSPELRPPNAAA